MSSFDEGQKKNLRDELNRISPSFCAAKWLQVTMHLHSGHNHSCHHPNTHKTPLEELKNNPSALHNTIFKKDQRQKMKHGVRPAECDYCWNVEDLGPSFLSDRTFKSVDPWARPHWNRLASLPANANVNPTYVEVSFSNACNFRCSYCSANFSSRWADDLKKHGNYSTGSGYQNMEIYEEDDNPYIKAFWDWWPDLRNDLEVFRITGGEPLLSKNTFRVLEELSKNPNPKLEICINSNLGISDANFQRFIGLAKDLTENNKVKLLRLYTSAEAWGERAEYIRNGLEFPRFQRNLETFLREVPKAKAVIMATFNALSVTSFKKLIYYVHSLKSRHTYWDDNPINIDTSYLRHPYYQSAQILPEKYLEEMEEIVRFMKAEEFTVDVRDGFKYQEIAKVERTIEWMKQKLPDAELKMRRQQFYKFFSEHDQRRDTNFLANFPEMEEFWQECKSLV